MTPAGERRWGGVLAAVALAGAFLGALPGAVAGAAAWLAFLAATRRSLLGRLGGPGFWLLSAGVALASGVLLGPADLHLAGIGISLGGVSAGATMLLRAVLVCGVAAWAGQVLNSEDLSGLAARVGAPEAGPALTTAFTLLPRFAERVRGAGPRPFRRGLLADLVADAARVAEGLAASPGRGPDGR